jgi:RNA polymerase sigma-70 factor (ECF subfamily)
MQTDAQIVSGLLARDEAVWLAVVAQLHPKLLRIARRVVGSDALAEDVVQDTWKAVLASVKDFAFRSRFSSWVIQVCLNHARTALAKSRTLEPLLADDDEEGDFPAERFTEVGRWKELPPAWPDAISPETVAQNRELVGVVASALAQLPPGQRMVVTLRDLEGLDSDEVCEALELSRENQRVLLHRGRLKLRAALERVLGPVGAAQASAALT